MSWRLAVSGEYNAKKIHGYITAGILRLRRTIGHETNILSKAVFVQDLADAVA